MGLIIVAALSTVTASTSFDVVVYDATSGGVTAAVSAARHGMRTALLCASWPACFAGGGKRIGGMSSGGLGQTDFGSHPEIIGGLALEFYRRNRQTYTNGLSVLGKSQNCRLPSAKCTATFNLEPSRAQSIFRDMLREAGVSIFYGAQVVRVRKTGTMIASVDTTTETGNSTFSAKMFIDASYEGDLFARAGISYIVGREARSAYNESLAGMSAGSRSNQFDVAVDPFDASGAPLPLTQLPVAGAVVGEGDKMVQAYNFRLCVTQNPDNMAPWPMPDNYSAATFELLRRYLAACEGDDVSHSGKGCQLGFPSCNTAPVPSSKFDSNNCGGISSDFIGASFLYPDASYAERRTIWMRHLQYHQGLLYTMAHDPQVPASVRSEMAKWGLCKDEFGDMAISPHWPPSLYVRAARRLQGESIFTQNTPSEQLAVGGIGNLSIGLGGYNFDSHNAQRLACRNASSCYGRAPAATGTGTPFAWDEGDVQIAPGVYQIPLTAVLPKRVEATNLLVVAAPSASHIGMSTLRMEPQFMIVGHSAGVVAALATRAGGAVHDVDTASAALGAPG